MDGRPEPLPEARSSTNQTLRKKGPEVHTNKHTNIQTHTDTYRNQHVGPVLTPLALDKNYVQLSPSPRPQLKN